LFQSEEDDFRFLPRRQLFFLWLLIVQTEKNPKNIFLEKGLAINRQKIHSIVISRSAITPFDFRFL
jgi:hypothetical protein